MARIEVCGAMASGKTTLVQALHKKGFVPLYERFEDNPFIGDGTNENSGSALEAEIVFLLLHANMIRQNAMCSSLVISDFSLHQDWCYSSINLSHDELRAFQYIYDYYGTCIQPTDLLICLRCPADILMQRIIKRNRKMEQNIQVEYLQSMIEILENSLKTFRNVLFVQSDKYNFCLDSDINQIVGKINKCLACSFVNEGLNG